jgi:hypothetical protein
MKGRGSSGKPAQPQQRSLPETIKALIMPVIDTPTAQIPAPTARQLLRFTQSIEHSAEVMNVLCAAVDHYSENALQVLQVLKFVYICLRSSPATFLPAAQAFAPEVETIRLIPFTGSTSRYGDLVHQTANSLYKYLVGQAQLPSSESLQVDDLPEAPAPQPKPAAASGRPSTEKVPDDKRPRAPAAFGGGAKQSPEDDNKPRVPAAFGTRTEDLISRRNGAENDSLLGGGGFGQTEDLLGLSAPTAQQKPSGGGALSLFADFDGLPDVEPGATGAGQFQLFDDDFGADSTEISE